MNTERDRLHKIERLFDHHLTDWHRQKNIEMQVFIKINSKKNYHIFLSFLIFSMLIIFPPLNVARSYTSHDKASKTF
jgi:hypothetical protein